MFQSLATLRAPMAPRFRLASLLGARVNQQSRIEGLRPVNQTRLFDALGKAGITRLTVILTGLGLGPDRQHSSVGGLPPGRTARDSPPLRHAALTLPDL